MTQRLPKSIRRRLRRKFAEMQTPQAKVAVRALFAATPEEIGKVAMERLLDEIAATGIMSAEDLLGLRESSLADSKARFRIPSPLLAEALKQAQARRDQVRTEATKGFHPRAVRVIEEVPAYFPFHGWRILRRGEECYLTGVTDRNVDFLSGPQPGCFPLRWLNSCEEV
jgi:hypothetical protein